MIHFEKISRSAFLAEARKRLGCSEEEALKCYDAIKLPARATKGSAGYDFFAPYAFTLRPGEAITILTGLRAVMPEGIVLVLVPRSGQGMRYKLQLMNTVGVIDSDYQFADNEGHIMVALYNDHPHEAVLEVEAGQAFCQGIFLPYYLTDDDATMAKRSGGFGSTDKKDLTDAGK